jgi:hypothetical protein
MAVRLLAIVVRACSVPSVSLDCRISKTFMSNRPLNVGLVGGGKGAFIVNEHQKSIHFDGTRRVTAAALSSNPKSGLAAAAEWP